MAVQFPSFVRSALEMVGKKLEHSRVGRTWANNTPGKRRQTEADREAELMQAQEVELQEKRRIESRKWTQPPSGHVAIQIVGDRRVCCEWLSGRWRPRAPKYQQQVADAQDTMARCKHFGAALRHAAAEPWEWVRRCCNTRADELTWLAREHEPGEWCTLRLPPTAAIRVSLDGGVDP